MSAKATTARPSTANWIVSRWVSACLVEAQLICDLVGIAIVAIGCSKIEGNLARLNPSELARAAERIERIQKKIVPYSEVDA